MAKVISRKTTPVNSSKFPGWLERILKKHSPTYQLKRSYQARSKAMEELLGRIGLDHWGTTKWNGIECFVTEPYGVNQDEVLKLKEKGRKLGFAVVYDPIAFHNPKGGCERILIFPTDLSPFNAYKPEVLEALKEAGCEIENGFLQPARMTIVPGSITARAKFESTFNELGYSPFEFFQSTVSVEAKGSGFVLRCLGPCESKLNRALKKSQKMAKEMRKVHPPVEIVAATDSELIPAGHGLFASNTSFFVGAFEHKDISSKSIERVEKLFLDKMRRLVARTARSDANEYDERHLFVELTMPITAKDFQELFRELDPLLEKIRYSGYMGQRVRKTSSFGSISDFFKNCLNE